MDNMTEEFKTADIGQVKSNIKLQHEKPAKVRSLKNAKNLTALNDLDEINAVGDRIVVALKAWPAQSAGGIFVPDSYVVIRGEQYITEVVSVGEKVSVVKVGDVAVVSMYSGHHITTQTGHAKIISESDIFAYKSKESMEKNKSFSPETFNPGINYILVENLKRKSVKSEAGLIVEVGEDSAFNTIDVATKTAVIKAVGQLNEHGYLPAGVGVGSLIVVDAYVGTYMNSGDVSESEKYSIMNVNDILGFVKKK